MKQNSVKGILFCAALFVAAATGYGAGVSNVEVTVSDAAGRLTYRGKTDANGVFATGKIAPGNYVVQLRAKNAKVRRNDYGIFAAAGHHRVVAEAVPGSKFASAGVALRLKPATSTVIIGQVAIGGPNELGTRIVNGRRMVLLPPETGDVGPRWVEEGTASGRNISRVKFDDPNMLKPASVSGVAQ
jgi:hypothetical protein